ncbi:MAG TPA: fumarylacetoacetate hydrolase family protein [Candidatus Sulfotelmatobacter sp.]|nr:fumarylacetoacetate hydrolase family protein [Candidatus Sulfotelmatobacter sp.]
MKIYRTASGLVAEHENQHYFSGSINLDALIARDDLEEYLRGTIPTWQRVDAGALSDLRAPIESQEVWGAGVTYYRSRVARMAESKQGGDFYDKVYDAERPEIFFKATPHRVVGPNQKVAIRSDSNWSVPEPEVALVISPHAKIVGYTVANDMSSRDIEGMNPLYLPQAKTYDRSCALGPALLVTSESLPTSTAIKLEILRKGKTAFSGESALSARKRTAEELVSFLFRHCSFPQGCFLMTGTGIVPDDSFTLHQGDEIRISVSGIGTLVNTVG